MAHLEANVPQQVEHELDGLVHVGRELGRRQEQKVDIRARVPVPRP